eukprot:1189053-Prorocentrum_minimum.AAC.2
MTADAYHITNPHPDGIPASRCECAPALPPQPPSWTPSSAPRRSHPDNAILCMTQAMAQAGLEPSDVNYINAHGTSTPAGDMAEVSPIVI